MKTKCRSGLGQTAKCRRAILSGSMQRELSDLETNTGNGRVTINASGSDLITITHTGNKDFTYPAL